MNTTGVLAGDAMSNWLESPVTLRFQNESLSVVLDELSKQIGIAILYDQELANERITGSYKNITVSEAINRLFSSKNKSISVDKQKKVVIVMTFGVKKFIWAGKNVAEMSEAFLGDDQVSLEELHVLQAQQYSEFQDEISDENEVIEGDMTRSELRAHIQQQNEVFQKSLKNDDEIIDGNKTRAQLREIVQQQYAEFKEGLKDGDEVIAEGQTRVQLQKLIQEQIDASALRLLNENEVIAGDKTRAQLKSELRQAGVE